MQRLVRRPQPEPVQPAGEESGDLTRTTAARRRLGPLPPTSNSSGEAASSGRSCSTYRQTASNARGSARSSTRSRRDFPNAKLRRRSIGLSLSNGPASSRATVAGARSRPWSVATMSGAGCGSWRCRVRKQYETALDGGTRIAGPRSRRCCTTKLDEEAVHWLRTNFLKTELELGHYLRLPAGTRASAS